MNQTEIEPGLIITNQRCAFIKKQAILVIGDLHVGYESVMEDSGFHLPHFQTQYMYESLEKLIEIYDPKIFLIVGDVKHEFSKNLSQEWDEVKKLFSIMLEKGEVIVVRGNHDNYLGNIASKLNISIVDEYFKDGFYFVHGHNYTKNRPLIIGHEHPSVRLFDEVGAFIKLPCFLYLKRERILVIPAFSPLAVGTDITSLRGMSPLSPILKNESLIDAYVYACSDIGLLYLGQISKLGKHI
ncbi:MAG: metallophosphoesterase [Methanomassiliicoccales archaeon]